MADRKLKDGGKAFKIIHGYALLSTFKSFVVVERDAGALGKVARGECSSLAGYLESVTNLSGDPFRVFFVHAGPIALFDGASAWCREVENA